MAKAVKLLVIEAMRKTVSASTGAPVATLRTPKLWVKISSPSTTTPYATPGMWRSSIRRRKSGSMAGQGGKTGGPGAGSGKEGTGAFDELLMAMSSLFGCCGRCLNYSITRRNLPKVGSDGVGWVFKG